MNSTVRHRRLLYQHDVYLHTWDFPNFIMYIALTVTKNYAVHQLNSIQCFGYLQNFKRSLFGLLFQNIYKTQIIYPLNF